MMRFEVDLLVFHVFDLLRAGGFAFDGDCAGVAEIVELREYLHEVDAAGADQDFLAELHWIRRELSILCVNAFHVRPNDVRRVHGIRFSVQNQIRCVETDAEIRLVHILQRARESGGSFLSGLHQEILAVGGAVLRDFADREDCFIVKRVPRIFGNEAAVRLDARDAEHFREVGGLLQRVDAGGASFAGHEADRRGPVEKVPHEAAGTDDFGARGDDAVLLEQAVQFLRESRE